MTRERTSRILELRKMFLSFKIGFDLDAAAVVFAILESISGLESSSDISYSKIVTVSSFRPFILLSYSALISML